MVTDEFITRAAATWGEFKHPVWAPFDPAPADEKRLWAIAFAADWSGEPLERMERLLSLLQPAIITASRMPAFIASRVGFWSVSRSTQGLERLAGGLTPDTEGRGWDCSGRTVVWASLPPDHAAAVHALAKANGISVSSLIGHLIEVHLIEHFTCNVH